MAPLFFTGIVLLIVAFVSAAAEGGVRAIYHMKGLFVSTQELWSALSPKTLIFARHAVEDIYPVLWDPFVLAIFSFPAWIVAGVPGMALVIYCRPASKRSSEPIDEESLYLIDDLVRNARLEGYDDEEGDIGSKKKITKNPTKMKNPMPSTISARKKPIWKNGTRTIRFLRIWIGRIHSMN
jgi:hypothetical protein